MPKCCISYCGSDAVTGCWNCVPPQTLILGDNKTIDEYKIGNHCVGQNEINVVTATFCRPYDGDLIHIKGAGLLPFAVSPEHPILASEGHFNFSSREMAFAAPYWKDAETLVPKGNGGSGDYLLIPRLEGSVEANICSLESFTTEHGLTTARGKKTPISYPLNSDTTWLLGLYVAEGSHTETEVLFTLGKNEEKTKARTTQIANDLGYSPHEHKGRGTISIGIPSRLLARAFPSWCGQKATGKKIPDFILFHKNPQFLMFFLDGYQVGDGYTRIDKRTNRTVRQAFSTVSKTLALQLQLAYARLGILAGMGGVTNARIGIIEGRKVRLHPNYRLEYRLGVRSKSKSKVFRQYILTPIRRVERTHFVGNLHNIETSDETYLVSNVIVHNCKRPYCLVHLRSHNCEFQPHKSKKPAGVG